jgi:glucan phosphoethanolaminetransferase (alkaline phosphatase superfamily)
MNSNIQLYNRLVKLKHCLSIGLAGITVAGLFVFIISQFNNLIYKNPEQGKPISLIAMVFLFILMKNIVKIWNIIDNFFDVFMGVNIFRSNIIDEILEQLQRAGYQIKIPDLGESIYCYKDWTEYRLTLDLKSGSYHLEERKKDNEVL